MTNARSLRVLTSISQGVTDIRKHCIRVHVRSFPGRFGRLQINARRCVVHFGKPQFRTSELDYFVGRCFKIGSSSCLNLWCTVTRVPDPDWRNSMRNTKTQKSTTLMTDKRQTHNIDHVLSNTRTHLQTEGISVCL